MSTITRRFTLTATRETRTGPETITLGRGVEFDGKDLAIDVQVLPVGNWWSGVAMLTDQAATEAGAPAPGRRFDLVAGKRAPGQQRATWLKVGTGMELVSGAITIDFHTRPEGNWWDGRLRLFEQKPDKPARGAARAKDC